MTPDKKLRMNKYVILLLLKFLCHFFKMEVSKLPEENCQKLNDLFGIPNLGNTCYLNCIFQTMLHTQPISDMIRRTPINEFKSDFQIEFRNIFLNLYRKKPISKEELHCFIIVGVVF